MSGVAVASLYSDWLRAEWPRGRSSNPGRLRDSFHVVHTGFGAHPVSYPMGTMEPFSGGKAAGM
jgi:hypothetical protein